MRDKNLLTLALLGLISLMVFLPGTPGMSLWDRDEACNAQCAREMLQRKDPIVPTFNFRLRTDKPPLEYWAMIASYKLLRVGEFAARLPSVLFSMGTVLLIFIFGSRLWSKEVGFLASLITVTNIQFPIIAKAATPDAVFLFFLTLSLFLFMENKVTRGYGAAGLAVLAKGPLGIIIPSGTEVLYLLFSQGKKGIKRAFPLTGLLAFFVIAAPWYILVDLRTHNQFYRGFILYHNITRFIRPIGGHRGPVFYYAAVLLLALIPWSPLLPQALYHLFQRAKKDKGVYLFTYLWILFPFTLFSLAKTKLPNYIMPVYPALALSMADVAREYVESGKSERLKPATTGTLIAVGMMVILLGVMWLKGLFVPPGLILVAGALLLLGAWSFYLTQELPLKWAKCLAALMIIFLVAIPYFIIPPLEQKKLSPSFAQKIQAEIREGDLIVTHPFSIPSLVFYTNHLVIREKKRATLKRFFDTHKYQRIFLITKAKKLRLISRTWEGKVKILEEGDNLYPRGKLVLVLLSPTSRKPAWKSGTGP